MDGKAMIVCMSRRICVDLYNALIKLRPEWAEETGETVARYSDTESGSRKNSESEFRATNGQRTVLKVVMTGSAEDGPEWQKHIRSKEARRKLANRFKDAKDPFKIVIVRDMWLTGFDALSAYDVCRQADARPWVGACRMPNSESRMAGTSDFP